MKHNKKINPLTHFNNLKAAAVKKAGKEMSTYKKSLKKAQDGMVAGPYEEGTAKYLDTKYPGTAMKFTGPVDPSYEADQRDKVARPSSFGWDRTSKLEAQDRSREEASLRSPYGDFNYGMGITESDAYKRGGRVKKQNGGGVGAYDEILKRNVKKNLAGSKVVKQTSRNYDPKSEEMSVTKTKTVIPKNAKAGDTVRQKSKSKITLSQKVLDNQKVGGSIKKMAAGGSLKPVPSDKVGLSKLPTPVRNKMGYQKKGGSVKRK